MKHSSTKKTVRIRFLILRLVITLLCLGAVLVLAEFYLRREVSYIVRKTIKDSGGLIEQNPEFLVDYTGGGRRYVPGAHVVIKNHFTSHKDVEMKINSLGFRDDEIPLEKQQSELRILALGDSITAADYLPREESFVERAEAYLQETLPDRKVSVINAGIGNIGTEEAIAILQERGLSLKPDIVMLNFYLNDSRPPWGFAGEIGDRGWLRRHSLVAEQLYRRIKEYDWYKDQGEKRFGWRSLTGELNWSSDREAFLKLAGSAEFDWGTAWQAESWVKTRGELLHLKELALRHKFEVLIVALPVSFQVYADFVEDYPQRELQRISAELGFSFLNLLPALREH
ncbi:MAG: hypothetical protein DCC75_08345, partial [Proteobacteria bacterium]